ncbi:hypothetical protein TNIN_290821 [Trichonephila inaurata madagascariensis]|uniref:Uncharacterized protein n=1 Tax=Trichonephila inaurata madagascariensis TaxID=2747483 RepID=A0A8X6XYF9_9ARAC|nr:hypothetical protein TNIN_290821 [Trichonephila inaurata madagascariensis]
MVLEEKISESCDFERRRPNILEFKKPTWVPRLILSKIPNYFCHRAFTAQPIGRTATRPRIHFDTTVVTFTTNTFSKTLTIKFVLENNILSLCRICAFIKNFNTTELDAILNSHKVLLFEISTFIILAEPKVAQITMIYFVQWASAQCPALILHPLLLILHFDPWCEQLLLTLFINIAYMILIRLMLWQ